MSESIAKRFFVAGRVQGVYYRASTRTQAQQLGLRGYAKNLPDGRVEVLAIGQTAALVALEEWLWRGPPAAHVHEVISEELDVSTLADAPTGFATQ